MKLFILELALIPFLYQSALWILTTLNNFLFIFSKNIVTKEQVGRRNSSILGAITFAYMGMFYSYASHQLFKKYPSWIVITITLVFLLFYLLNQRKTLKQEEVKLKELEFDFTNSYKYFIMSNSVAALRSTIFSIFFYVFFLLFENESNSLSFGFNKWLYDLLYDWTI